MWRPSAGTLSLIHISTSLKELDVEPEKIEEMAVKCTNYGKRTLPGIKDLGKEEMMEISRLAM